MTTVEVTTGQRFDFTIEVPPHVSVEVQSGPTHFLIEVSQEGAAGPAGKNAFELWLLDHPGATFDDYEQYFRGLDGKNAFELWQEENPMGTFEDYKAYFTGPAGQNATNNTLELVRAANNQINGDIQANGHTVAGIRNASSNQEPVTLVQLQTAKDELKAYSDLNTTNTTRWVAFWDFTAGQWPTGITGGIRRGDEFEANNVVMATMPDGTEIEYGDVVRARISTPGQTAGNWSVLQGNSRQATPAVRGVARIISATEAANENSTNDTEILTAGKWWTNTWQRARQLAWTWTLRQTYTAGIRLMNASAGQYLKTDTNKDVVSVGFIPAADVQESTSKMMSTLAQQSSWTAKAEIADLVSLERYFIRDVTKSANAANGVLTEQAIKSYVIAPGTWLNNSSLLHLYVRLQRDHTAFNATLRVYLANSNSLSATTKILIGSNTTTATNKNPQVERKLALVGSNLEFINTTNPTDAIAVAADVVSFPFDATQQWYLLATVQNGDNSQLYDHRITTVYVKGVR